MTERPQQLAPVEPARQQKRPERSALAVAWLTCAVFLAVLAVLAARMRAGEDPALKAARQSASLPPRHVLVRRVLERRVVVHVPASEAAPATSSTLQVGAAGAFGPSLPSTRTS